VDLTRFIGQVRSIPAGAIIFQNWLPASDFTTGPEGRIPLCLLRRIEREDIDVHSGRLRYGIENGVSHVIAL
jgi:hypothetical protein